MSASAACSASAGSCIGAPAPRPPRSRLPRPDGAPRPPPNDEAGGDLSRLERHRAAAAALVGAAPEGVIFTSGGTEANNLALAGSGRARLLVSAIEHASIWEA